MWIKLELWWRHTLRYVIDNEHWIQDIRSWGFISYLIPGVVAKMLRPDSVRSVNHSVSANWLIRSCGTICIKDKSRFAARKYFLYFKSLRKECHSFLKHLLTNRISLFLLNLDYISVYVHLIVLSAYWKSNFSFAGMILELETETVKQFLSDKEQLQQAIARAFAVWTAQW